MAGTQLGAHFLIFLDGGDVVDIDDLSLVVADEFDGILDMSEAALTEDIVLVVAPVFGAIHVEVCDGKALGH